MSVAGAAFTVAVLLSLAYVAMAVVARRCMKAEVQANDMQRLIGLMLWWPFYDVYEPQASRLRAAGVVVLCLGVVAYVASAQLA